MTDCPFCDVPPFKPDDTPVWLIGDSNNPTGLQHSYKSVTNKIRTTMNSDEFKQSTKFTPGARLNMTLAEANELLTHTEIWEQISTNHTIIFTDESTLNNADLNKILENLTLPRDWDIIILPFDKVQYVLTKRAANILIASSRQFHKSLKVFIESIPGLRIVHV